MIEAKLLCIAIRKLCDVLNGDTTSNTE